MKTRNFYFKIQMDIYLDLIINDKKSKKLNVENKVVY